MSIILAFSGYLTLLIGWSTDLHTFRAHDYYIGCGYDIEHTLSTCHRIYVAIDYDVFSKDQTAQFKNLSLVYAPGICYSAESGKNKKYDYLLIDGRLMNEDMDSDVGDGDLIFGIVLTSIFLAVGKILKEFHEEIKETLKECNCCLTPRLIIEEIKEDNCKCIIYAFKFVIFVFHYGMEYMLALFILPLYGTTIEACIYTPDISPFSVQNLWNMYITMFSICGLAWFYFIFIFSLGYHDNKCWDKIIHVGLIAAIILFGCFVVSLVVLIINKYWTYVGYGLMLCSSVIIAMRNC
eukprot:308351_1